MYSNQAVVPCRKWKQTQEVITSDKRVVKVECVYYLAQKAAEGDLLDGRRVQAVKEMTGLDGSVQGYKAVV